MVKGLNISKCYVLLKIIFSVIMLITGIRFILICFFTIVTIFTYIVTPKYEMSIN